MTRTTNILRTTTRAASFFALTLFAGTVASGALESASPSHAHASSSIMMESAELGITGPAVVQRRDKDDVIDIPERPQRPVVIRTPFGTIVVYR